MTTILNKKNMLTTTLALMLLTTAALASDRKGAKSAMPGNAGLAGEREKKAENQVTAQDAPQDPKVARGAYLVTTSACHDCHTPFVMGPKGPEPDMTRMLSGHPADVVLPPAPALTGPWVGAMSATNTAWAGPWGVSFTANLTPDKETGLGLWNARTFIETVRNGRHMGRGRPLLPPMPWPMYRHMTDADLEAIFAFLQSIPPIKNRVPQPVPPAKPVSAQK